MKECSLEIVLTKYPWPEAETPELIQEAHIGLRLRPDMMVERGETNYLPLGAYMVPVEDVLQAMAKHNNAAHVFLVCMWGDIKEVAESSGRKMRLVFPTNCCEVVH